MEPFGEDAEELFLLGRFQEALNLSESQLEELQNVRSELEKSTSSLSSSALPYHNLSEIFEESVAPMSIVIQSLFELGRAKDILAFVQKFYGDLETRTPYAILHMCIQLQIALTNMDKARMLAENVFQRFASADPLLQPFQQISRDNYQETLGLVAVKILAATGKFEAARQLVSSDTIISIRYKAELAEQIDQMEHKALEEAKTHAALEAASAEALSQSKNGASDRKSSTSAQPSANSTRPSTDAAPSSSSGVVAPPVPASDTGTSSLFRYSMERVSALQRFIAHMEPSQRRALFGAIIAAVLGTIYVLVQHSRLKKTAAQMKASFVGWIMRVIGSNNQSNPMAQAYGRSGPSMATRSFQQQQLQLRSRF